MKIKCIEYPRNHMAEMMVRAGTGYVKFTKGQISGDLPEDVGSAIMAKWKGCFEIYRDKVEKLPRSNKMAKAPENK